MKGWTGGIAFQEATRHSGRLENSSFKQRENESEPNQRMYEGATKNLRNLAVPAGGTKLNFDPKGLTQGCFSINIAP